ncbi:DNA alkylation repair protein [Poseidonibacter antarcticus]|uniref:DNA alkylation repair protein n=1 Tax=Poseidonibacter antarcticus TaxID=2478538 RepID=UPI000EF451BB|nr:DNA alkylation repair protein [Poseidonibacter antarcticus]
MKNYLQEIEKITSKAGETVPLQRKSFKRGFSFKQMSFNEQLEIWSYIWTNTKVYRAEMFCLYFLEEHIKNKEKMLSSWSTIKLWQDKINRWETSDSISKIYAQLVEYDAELILPTYKKWNTSKNPWHRRQSIVGLLYYSAQRKHYLPFQVLIDLVAPLISDNAYYVEKGVGWTLREIGNIYPKEQEEFLFKNATKICAYGYSAGTEKWDKTKREKLKEVRKVARFLNRKNSISKLKR